MKTELMCILKQRELEKEVGRLDKIYKSLMDKKDAEGNPDINPADALALQTAKAINDHKLKLIRWVLDAELIKA